MIMNALVLLLALSSVIVLRSGDRIQVDGAVKQENGVVTFKSGRLFYTLPSEEVERIETAGRKAETEETAIEPAAKPAPIAPRRLRATEEERKRLLAELEQNHGGQPAVPQKIMELPPAPTRAETAANKREETQWRTQARAHEEAILRANEELSLLETRAAQLQEKIHSLIALGYKPPQFTYDTRLLASTLEQIPYAKLEVTRAERAFAQFKDDARKDGVPPGWLR